MVKSHSKLIEKLNSFQASEKEAREKAQESLLFIRGGHQWEERARKIFKGKPMFELDRVYPVITGICGDIQDVDFAIRIVEAGAGASGDIAKTYDGMVRSIQNMSHFSSMLAQISNHVVTAGFDAVQIVSDWADCDAFEQDLLIKPIPDAIHRVWLGPTEEIDHSDCKEGFILTSIGLEEYDAEYPDGARQSVGSNVEICENDSEILIGEYFYLKMEDVTLYLLSNDKVVRAEQYDKVRAEQEAKGVTIVRERTRKLSTCYVKKFDGGGWLEDAGSPTPFGYIPIAPVYGHYDMIDGKRAYFGVTEKLKDPQRIYNYAKSREISEGALAPIEKIAATEKQVAGHEAQNSKLNNDSEPLFIYNNDPQAMSPPFKMPGNQPNTGLAMTQQGAALDIQEISSSFNPARGQGLSGHSGVAYEMLQNKSNLSSIDYVNAIKLAVQLIGKILIDAIPKVYDTRGRQVRLLNEDGTSQYESINEEVFTDNGTMEVMRDLSQGHYDVVVTTGKPFASKKTAGVDAMLTISQAYPAILEEGADLFLKAMDAPYIEQIGDRVRARMVKNGMIPESQLTEDEREKIMQEMEAQRNAPPDPMQTATLDAVMAEVQRLQSEAAKNMQDIQIQMMEQQRKDIEMILKTAKTEAEVQKMQADTVDKLVGAETNGLPGESGYEAATKVATSIKV